MIQIMQEDALDKVHALWLKTNLETHTSIDPQYFISNSAHVKEALKEALIYVFLEDDTILGFIGLIDNNVAGIFVQDRSKGIGHQLLEYTKRRHSELNLFVFKDNHRAINFYKKHDFLEIETHYNEEVKAYEIMMSWHK